ncbi:MULTISPECIES: type II toxin-antitoxin system MqsA family antitoxin [Methylomicrobium]|uniref:Putative zinc finger/helix-turn-helix protein, YgiT family n=1 Tax=Methylomicrobium album BG8 TaxID=686340 RepID=H8GLP0_METAL|nr:MULTISPECIES: type II toxin-antitoxin system MqsA family antitoxin [Methylomicrobium]EIC30567.1 putative zinc finger/helix-turn-helix protein, YgiT family [Methylomicrobium album BG8]
MSEPRYCLQCDDGTVLVYETKDISGLIDGASYEVPAVAGWHCPVCGEVEFDAATDSAERHSAALAAARKSAITRRSAELRAIRKRLGLNQAEAGRLFGGGVSAFSEYECGKTQPHKSTLLLLRLLNKHPELLNEVRRET